MPDQVRTTIHAGRKYAFEMVTYTNRLGQTVSREMVNHPGAVCVVPVLPSGELAMISVHRFALDRELIEFPAGTIEPPTEDPAACAHRELVEETGYRAASLTPLGAFYTTPGMTNERMHAFVARDLTFVGQELEDDEQIVVRPVSTSQALAMLDTGEIRDAKTIVSLLWALRRGLIS